MGRYDDTPRELILELVEDAYRRLGTPEELDRQASKQKVWDGLSDEPRDVPTLANEAALKEKEVRKALELLVDHVIREGKGRKGDPYTYRRANTNSIRSQSHPLGEETNSAPQGAAAVTTVIEVAPRGEEPQRRAL